MVFEQFYVLFNDSICIFFLLQDLYIGVDVVFYNFQFILIDVDEYVVNYMEKYFVDFFQVNI